MQQDKTIAIISAVFAFSLFAETTTSTTNGFDNLYYGILGRCDRVINRDGYALGYVDQWRQPSWVAYRLTPEEASAKETKRTNAFAADSALPLLSATPSDYKNSGYDKGHLAPAGDMSWSEKAMAESFLMSNMSPQTPAFNRGIWKKLERFVRDTASAGNTLFIYTGPIFYESPITNSIGRSRVLVPSAFYKVVLKETPPKAMIAFLVPNCATNGSLATFSMSCNAVESISGICFYPLLPIDLQNRLKKEEEPIVWGLAQ